MKTKIALAMMMPLVVLLAAANAAPDPTEEETWRAYWVWGSKNMNAGKGYFRLPFTVDGDLASAVLQGSGDDGYVLFVNGKEVRRSGFGFNRIDRTDLLAHLKQGANVLAGECTNAAFPGGWLAQLHLVYRDGRDQFVLSDKNTRFRHEAQPGWNTLDFDDSAWEKCEEVARPPGGAWGPLPLEYAGQRSRLELVDFSASETIDAGDTLIVKATVRALEPIPADRPVYAEVMRGATKLGRVSLAPDPVTSQWTVGREIAIGPLEVPISRYITSGPATVVFGVSKCSFGQEGNVATHDVEIRGREGTIEPPEAWVAPHQGAPALFVNGRPMPAMLYLQGRKPVPAEYAQMAQAGYKVFSLGIGMGWTGPDQYDYASVDEQMLAALQGAPAGYFIPRVMVSAPGWWCDAHPDELIACADWTKWVDDVHGGTKHESFASKLWREEAGEALRGLIEHIRTSPYADRVIGYHIASGIYGEWHLWSPTHLPDVSRPMTETFQEWATQKYNEDMKALNYAWKIKLASFQEVTCATEEERYASGLGVFKDLSRSRFVSDYWQCLHETTVGAINHFCKIAKDATAGKAVTGVFYAYLTDMGWPQEGGHLAAQLAYESPYIDFFTSPHTYSHRGMGQDGAFRAYPASIQLHGKLFIDEGDDRTHLSGDKPHMHANTIEQDIAIMRREALNALTNRVGMWWFDMTSGWFNDPLLLETAKQLRELGEHTLARPRGSYAEIAVVYDPASYYALADWKTGKDALIQPLCNAQFQELQKIGAPYDVLLIDDVLSGVARPYKCYVFPNTWHMTAAQRDQATERLQRGDTALVFAYAPGFSSDTGLDAQNMTQLTGMDFEVLPEGGTLEATWTEQAGAISGIQTGDTWGTANTMAPRFSPQVSDDGVLARWDDGSPAAALAAHDGWTSVYCGTGPIPAALLAHAAQLAGVHIWTPAWLEESNFYAGNGLLGVHTGDARPHSFSLPWQATVTDAITGEVLLENGTEFTVLLPKWSTAIYELEPVVKPE